ncbi:helix-turn-helix transcriptional regulator [Patulibacter brassicae]|jgi:PadR family transcriptional regulator AphA|uniref:Helix-turn-helix transcriptional regulator n=1 Tax=Patulibacter brassicae TaxID=1705717 RepID=A0ABU4VFZ2_9ACTN|nr:helix-turn-helix transcriptional regulator [Patulibacter brassicae]MDX8150747.1 helix-turn-helix transcriptional regulator [Patulibacter brassicae]
MRRKTDLLVHEWLVLALVAEEPRHGYAVAELLAPDGDLGRIWRVGEPLCYRAIATLDRLDLVAVDAVLTGGGPPRKRYAATAAGRERLDAWLATPERRLRELRPGLLLKLRLLERAGADRRPLLEAQRALLTDLLDDLGAPPGEGDDTAALLDGWRRAVGRGALAFVQERLDAEG